jgi:lipopolysaccharide exporter
VALNGAMSLPLLLVIQIGAGALAFALMILFSRHPLVVEMKRQLCRSEKMKVLLRAG